MADEIQVPLARMPISGDGKTGTPHCAVFKHGVPAPAPRELTEISEILKEGDALVWLDVVDPGPLDLSLLQEEFDLHPLAIEDAVHEHQRPKIESYDRYWFVVAQGVSGSPEDAVLHEISIFVGEKFLVTVRDDPPYPLDEIERRWVAQPPERRRDAGFLLYAILDTIVDGYLPLADAYEERAGALEDSLLRDEHPDTATVLRDLFTMRGEVQALRRAAVPMRDLLAPMIRGDLHLFHEDELAYYRDVDDHAVQVVEALDAARDTVAGALQIHVSVTSNRLAEASHRQGEVNKQLTLIATIFLPLSFITGFFGQNFGWLVSHIVPAATFWWLGLGSEVVALAALVAYIRYRRWY